jgi:hypothetical protein
LGDSTNPISCRTGSTLNKHEAHVSFVVEKPTSRPKMFMLYIRACWVRFLLCKPNATASDVRPYLFNGVRLEVVPLPVAA